MNKSKQTLRAMAADADNVVNEALDPLTRTIFDHAERWGEDDDDKGAILVACIGMVMRKLLRWLDEQAPPRNKLHQKLRKEKLVHALLADPEHLRQMTDEILAGIREDTVQ